MSEDPALAKARRDAAAARARLLGNAHALQERLNPTTIAETLWDDARARGGAIAGEAARVARERPVATSAVAAGVAALIFRKPLARLFARLRGPAATRAAPSRRSRRHNGDHR